LEGFFRKKKKWDFINWKKYLLNHPLIELLSKKLIWQFTVNDKNVSGIFFEGQLISANNIPLTGIEESSVSLWHPSTRTVEEVQNWRNFIFENEIKQPFKQAFREVYLVTDAEINTLTYSNRYLNHVLRHDKFAAIAKNRLWDYSSVYSYNNPRIQYSDFKIEAMVDSNNSDYSFFTVGRVHFRNLIFSETMRDIDLFVGVCSIGMEDQRLLNFHQNYLNNFSQSELTSLGENRKKVLERLIPRLKIKEQCVLTEKNLIVKGKIRTYKIHLGSGNILMTPNDQYLCIIPNNKKNQPNVFLPFDDDKILSLIISKALLLADDDKIEDEVILHQINQQ